MEQIIMTGTRVSNVVLSHEEITMAGDIIVSEFDSEQAMLQSLEGQSLSVLHAFTTALNTVQTFAH
jgi:hypothetical protein